MPERLHRLASSIDPTPSAAADHGAPGKQTRAQDLPGSAAATQTAVSRVKAYRGEPVEDVAGFRYLVTDAGAFEVTFAPPPSERAVGRAITPDGKLARAWMTLARILFARPPKAKPGPAAATAPAGADRFPSLGPVVDAIDQATRPLAALLGGLFDDPTEVPAVGPPAAADGKAYDANLAAAEQLAETTTVPHTDSMKASGGVAGDVAGWKRREAIVDGDVAKMKTMVCSEFTSLTLQKTGVDLNQRYIDPGRNLPVGYRDAAGNLVFADLYRVTMNQADALEAILVAQHQGGDEIAPGTPEARAIRSTVDFKFIHVKRTGDLSLKQGDVIGAGATAQQLGGTVVAEKDRRPGDLQQWMNTTKGKGGSGHSSQIWAVRGKGVAYLGAPGSPTLKPAPAAEIPPGWYAVDGVYWEAGPGTDPELVASLDVEYVQLIEANLSTTDATHIADMHAADKPYDPDAERSRLTSTGRLPTSKWAAWKASAPVIAGTIKPGGVVSAPSE